MATRQRNEAFVRLRKAAGLTQRGLVAQYTVTAARIGVRGAVSERTVARWEAADPPCPAPAQQHVLEALFGVPLEEMGFDVPEHRRVARREFLADVGALSAAGLIHTTNGTDPGPRRTRADAADLRRIAADVEQVYVVDHAQGSGSARPLAEQLAARVTAILAERTYLEAVGTSLQNTLGAVTAHLGWLAFDGAHLDAARAYCLEALATGRMTGDPYLEASTLANLALIAIEQSRAWEAVSAAQAAWAVLSRHGGPTVRAMLCAREADALGAAGDLPAARRALSLAMANYDRSGRDEAPRWAQFFGPGELDQATAAYYLAAGKPGAAVPFLRQTVGSLGDGYARNAAHYRAKLALALLDAGEVDEACAEALQVCAHLERVDSAKVHARLREFRARAAGVDARCAAEAVERIDAALVDG